MTRNVANWFHDRDGELFTVDETPFTREEIVQVVNDSVDPVQQVIVDGEKYIGVISYDEHDGWYEYTRWDDAAGEVTMGVCAKCVEEAEYVDEVSRTVGDSTDVAREKFDHHYEEAHDVHPDEVNTGATLLSGTTINGNTAIHPGMDGSGSGVDADFVLGNEALQTGSFYSFTQNRSLSNINERFASPSANSSGLGIDNDSSIWITDFNGDKVFELNTSGTVQSSANITLAQGVDSDSSNSIWVYGHNSSNLESIFELNQSGTKLSNFVPTNGSGSAMTIDSNDSIIYVTGDESIYKTTRSGSEQYSRSIYKNDPRGVSARQNGSLWLTIYSDSSIYLIDQNQNEIDSSSGPNTEPGNNGVSGIDEQNNSVWFVHKENASVYSSNISEKIEFN